MKKLILFLMLLFSVFSFAQTTKTFYTCPMHPEVISSKPGDCSKCGMTLVKKTVVVKPKAVAKPQVKPLPKTETKPTEIKSKIKAKARVESNVDVKKVKKTKEVDKANMAKPVQDKTPRQVKPQPKVQSQSQKYTCPMHPEVISDKPGKCPKCGMDLIEKEDNTKDTLQPESQGSVLKRNSEKWQS